ncbi:FGGY-family carbohydrate kinase [Caballeronia sp. TF1N1]|uniref:FGGY-family carbohydrate kinase n=1 Tax=Caballeronia sp. TF1N1 TaxID=2878153 RepID=UPI001FD33264|nr:FGGY-family carbohydrate kinase [Caballeronia sp. TF1N1]
MSGGYLIGLDYGTDSARGVLVDIESGEVCATHAHRYRHGTLIDALPGGLPLKAGWALQNAPDYLECAEVILAALGRGKRIEAIGIGFTASSPLPASADGTPLSTRFPDDPHAYVKLWKHQSAQPWADEISRERGVHLTKSGGKTSGEWLPAKAAQLAAEAPTLWAQTERFIEAGDWLVWQLTGTEARSSDMARYKAHYSDAGYPPLGVDGLATRSSAPKRIGSSAGTVRREWIERTGMLGEPAVAVAAIDSHVILPAIGATQAGTLVGALGTSAVYMLLDDTERPLPDGIEGVAKDAALPGLWCYEAGQAGFGDALAWFVKTAPLAEDLPANFSAYNASAARLRPGESGLLALDWWNGCRVPLSDPQVSGMLLGLRTTTTRAEIYRAMMESLCFGARTIIELMQSEGAPVTRTILASGLSENNRFLLQLMADVLGKPVSVPDMHNATAVGAAIHGAVAAGVVRDFTDGAARFGARAFQHFEPDAASADVYEALFEQYRMLASRAELREAMHVVSRLALPR